MFWFLVGVASALPPALLGSSGPQWVGTLPPGELPGLVAVVDPSDGKLIVEATERDGRTRKWQGDAWLLGGEPIDVGEPAVGHRIADGRLVSAHAAFSANHEFQYTDAGLMSGLLWANGEKMTFRYDGEGRVREIVGPGTKRLTLKWANSLRWSDGLGRTHTLQVDESGPNRTVTLTDPVGRTVSTRYRKRDQQWSLTRWTDPRGLETRIGNYNGRMDITAPGGRVYRVEVGSSGEVSSVTMPAGHKWRWERTDDGRVYRMFDPAGRVTRIERNEAGKVVTVSPSGRVKRLVRSGEDRIVAIHSSTGAVTQLVRDDSGHVRSIIDALGNQIFIERFANGWPSGLLERTGARWTLGTDTLGEVDRIEGPMGRVTQLHRNGAGWLERIEDNVHGVVSLGYDNDGRLTSVSDVVGRRTRFERDAAGWLQSIERPDGETLQIERNPVGEIIRLRFGADVWDIERTPDGWPRVMGEHRWERDINGAVRKMKGPLGEVTFTRDPAGWIRSVAVGSWALDIERDANGWPVGWTGTDGSISLQRDGAGRVVKESGPYETRVLRDPRGLPVRIVAGKLGEWRTQRDASGRPLTVKGPEGVALSIERDLVGRPKWFRFPDGSILRRAVSGAVTDDVLVSPAGSVSGNHKLTRDADGRAVSWTASGGGLWQVERDAAGNLLAVTSDAGPMWSFEPERVLDPEGRLQLYDAAGWLIEAQLPVGVRAWGVGGEMLSVLRDDSGRISGLGGTAGVSPVQFDDLGRLTSYKPPDGEAFSIRYDARGRPIAISGGETPAGDLVWSPDVDPADGLGGLLATGVEAAVPWVFTEEGMAARRNGMEVEALIADGRGDPAWLLDGAGGAVMLAHDYGGMPAQAGSGIVGASGRLQWFEGGPVQVGPLTVDPVSGQRVDGVSDWPWVSRDPRVVSTAHPSDPGPWAPESAWSQPLRILEALGEIQPIDEESWEQINEMPRAHFSVPESIDTADPPLGPNREALPLGEEDPLTEALIRSLLPGGSAIGPQGPAAALIGSEIALPWLPPGWEVPGLESWRRLGAWSDDE